MPSRRLFASLALLALSGVASAQTTFTYQGRLDDAGLPTSGVFDLQFRLFDDPLVGAQQGATVCAEDVLVAPDGTFTVNLDFGSTPIAHQRFLEIRVRDGTGIDCTDPSGFEVLPRQTLTSAPFAIRALLADDASTLNGQPASFFQNAANLSLGTIPDARLAPTVARTNVATTFTAPVTINNPASIFVGNGAGLLSLNASNISSGVLAINLGGTGANTSSATAGQVLKFNSGAWLPGNDLDTTYTAGPGLTLIGTTFSVPSQGIVAGMLANSSVDTFAIAPGAIINSDLSDNSISTSKIINNAVTGIKIAPNAVNATHISDGSIGNADLQANSIAGFNIINGTITNDDLAVNSVNTFTILDATITSADIALDTILAADIAPGAIGVSELAPDAVTNAALASDAASLARVTAGAMTATGSRIAINGAPGAHELTVNGRIEATTGLTSLGTITAAEFVHQTPLARVYSFSPYDVTIRDGGVEFGEGNGSNYAGDPFLRNGALSATVQCVLPIHLPDGAVVTNFTIYCSDNATGSLTAQILRRSYEGDPGGTMAQITTNTNSSDVFPFSDTTISAPTIDNDDFLYYIRLEFPPAIGGDIRFRGGFIRYTVARPLP